MLVMDNSSFRNKFMNVKKNSNFYSTEVYYGRSNVGVPFMWESQPGTPKVKHYDRPLPPLTPPPSFIYSMSKKPLKKQSKSNLMNSLHPKLNLCRGRRKPTYPILSSSSSTSSSMSSSKSVPASLFDLAQTGTRWIFEDDEHGSPVSTLCFGIRCAGTRRKSSKTMKALLGELE